MWAISVINKKTVQSKLSLNRRKFALSGHRVALSVRGSSLSLSLSLSLAFKRSTFFCQARPATAAVARMSEVRVDISILPRWGSPLDRNFLLKAEFTLLWFSLVQNEKNGTLID
jgi:hypothetical protein